MTMWEHIALLIGGIGALTVGAVDALTRQRLGFGVDVGLIAGGLGALGVKGVGLLPS